MLRGLGIRWCRWYGDRSRRAVPAHWEQTQAHWNSPGGNWSFGWDTPQFSRSNSWKIQRETRNKKELRWFLVLCCWRELEVRCILYAQKTLKSFCFKGRVGTNCIKKGFGMIWDSKIPTFRRFLQPKKHLISTFFNLVNPSNLQNSYTTNFWEAEVKFHENPHFPSVSEKSAYLPLGRIWIFFFTCTEPSIWISAEAQDGHARSGGGISHQRRLWSGRRVR